MTEKTMTGIEEYAAPATVEEAVQLLAGGKATLLAGGTDLMPQTSGGLRQFAPLLLNLRRIPELHGITRQDETIRLGTLTTITEILEDELLQIAAPILPTTADCFASGQVRNSATLGGNICNASPAGDMIIPLLLLDAEVELATWKQGEVVRRTMPIDEFFTGPGQTHMEANEILTAFQFAVPDENHVAVFRKFGTRPALDISIVSVGIAGRRAQGVPGLCDVRVAFGAVAPVPLRGRRTEAALERQPLTYSNIAQAASTAADEISPISDVRASAWYRTQIARVLTERLLRDVSQAED